MSVDSAAAQMANTTLTEPTGTAEGASVGAGGDKPINASQNEAVIASAAEGRRLYIGNLAYATTEGELKEFFKEYLVYVLTPLMAYARVQTDVYHSVRPHLSQPTRAPPVQSATPSWTFLRLPRPSAQLTSSMARPSWIAKSLSSLPASQNQPRRQPRAARKRRSAATPLVAAVAVDGDEEAVLLVAVVA
jgi:hypothetical protein